MRTIVVSGAYSGIGKTAYAERLLNKLSGYSALKVTLIRKTLCPRHNNCGVCEDFNDDFKIISDNNIITKERTDTARLKNSGAKKVIWLKATAKGLKKGLVKALSLLKASRGVIIEGTTVLKYIKPDLAIFLCEKNKYLRPAAEFAHKRANLIIDVSR